MGDQEQEYPKHQPGRGNHDHHDPFAIQEEGELEDQPRKRGEGPVHQREAATLPQLPAGHARKALIIGAIAGILASAQGVVLTLVNSGAYNEADKYINNASKMPLDVASKLVGLFVLGVVISALIYFIGGLIIGRVSVRRRWAFIGGFLGGIISSLIGDILKLIPSYPNAGNNVGSGGVLGVGSGFVALLIGFILLGVLAGLVSLFGAWLTTRRHPYYVGYSG